MYVNEYGICRSYLTQVVTGQIKHFEFELFQCPQTQRIRRPCYFCLSRAAFCVSSSMLNPINFYYVNTDREVHFLGFI